MMRITLERKRHPESPSICELARRAGMHPATVGQIESGRLVPYPSQIAKLAAALGWTGEPAALLDEIAGDSQP